MERMRPGCEPEEGLCILKIPRAYSKQSVVQGFRYYTSAEDADILVLTETKVNNPPVGLLDLYESYWSISDTKGYGICFILLCRCCIS
jgi:hypothetical protein